MYKISMDNLRAKIRNNCIRLLKYRPRARGEMIERLKRKKFPQDLIEKVVNEFVECGLVDDREFVKYWVNWRLEVNPRGKNFTRIELRQKGVDEDLINEALDNIPPEDELAIARELASKQLRKLKNLEPEKIKNRIYAYLKRRGFKSEIIWDIIKDSNENR